jgi:hypothetical protein
VAEEGAVAEAEAVVGVPAAAGAAVVVVAAAAVVAAGGKFAFSHRRAAR